MAMGGVMCEEMAGLFAVPISIIDSVDAMPTCRVPPAASIGFSPLSESQEASVAIACFLRWHLVAGATDFPPLSYFFCGFPSSGGFEWDRFRFGNSGGR